MSPTATSKYGASSCDEEACLALHGKGGGGRQTLLGDHEPRLPGKEAHRGTLLGLPC